jgi:hypothetical protein
LDLRLNTHYYEDFQAYESFVQSRLAGILDNGSSPNRKVRSLEPVTCLSTGYDSTGATAIAAALGVNNALTLDIIVNTVDDNGMRLAKEMGIKCKSAVHPAGQTINNLHMSYEGPLLDTAREFIGTAGFGDDILYAAFEDSLKGSILLDGKLGDGIWDKNCMMQAGMPLGIPYSKSLNEFRVRVGFAHVPVPAIGADFPESIARLSRSKAMKKWSIGGRYDRPIPRRLVEAAGGKRASFGQLKGAANPHPTNFDELKHDALKAMVDRYL